jgi:hypothetical protein
MSQGYYYGSGLATGLKSSIPLVEAAGQQLAETLTNTTGQALTESAAGGTTATVPSNLSNITKAYDISLIPENVKDVVYNANNTNVSENYVPKNQTKKDLSGYDYSGLGYAAAYTSKGMHVKSRSTAYVDAYTKSNNLFISKSQAARDATKFYAKYSGMYATIARQMIDKTYGFNRNVPEVVDIAGLRTGLEKKYGIAGGTGTADMLLPEGYNPRLITRDGKAYALLANGQEELLTATQYNTKTIRANELTTKEYTEVLVRVVEKLDKTEKMRIEAARGAKSDVERYIKSGDQSPFYRPTTYFERQPTGYYVGGVYMPGEHLPSQQYKTETQVTYRQKTPEELAAMPAPGYIKLTQIPVSSMRGDFANLPLDQYSTPEYDVAKGVKQFQFATGDRAIEQRGLTKMFANENIANQFANIGNRAATYLSLRQGQLKPNEVIVYKQLLEQDRQDRLAYMDAVRVAQEQINAGGDATSIIQNLITANQGKTQSFKDVFDVKVGSLKDYTAEMGGSFDQFAKLGPQAFMSVALNPENQSAAFKALSPDAQQKLIESVQNMPSQAMAFLGDAMADGTLDSTEFDTYMAYVGEDIKNMRNILMRGTPPTQEEIDAAYNPFIDGAATVVASDKVTGVLGNALVGASKILFESMGKEAWDAFLKGWMTNEKGEKVSIGAMTFGDLLKYTPENLIEAGIPTGNNIMAGIAKGVQQSLFAPDSLITTLFKKNGTGWDFINREVIKAGSPSKVARDMVGINIGLGIAEGVAMPEVMNKFGTNVLSLLNPENKENPFMTLIAETAKIFGVFIGTNIGDGVLSISKATGPENLWMRSLITPLMDQISQGNFSLAFYATGRSITQGVAAGITSATDMVTAAIKDLVDTAVKYSMTITISRSPSRLFANKVGSPIAQGIALGITNDSSMVSDALNPLLTDNAMYKADISGAAINGMIRRSQTAVASSNVENNYNLSLATSYPGQTVQQQFEIMRAFKGNR